MRKLRTTWHVLILIAGTAFVSNTCFGQDDAAEAARKQMLEERRLLEQAHAKADQLRLKEHPAGTGKMLQKLDSADIKAMQIFRINTDGSKGYIDPPLAGGTIQGILALCNEAKPFVHPGRGERAIPDSVVVVKLLDGKSFEIEYSSILGEPFGGLVSRELKEALYFLSGQSSRFSIIHFVEGKVVSTRHGYAGMLGTASSGLSNRMWLDSTGKLILHLKMSEKDRNTMDHKSTVHYGDAQTYPHKGEGHTIVLLHKAR